MDVQSLYTSIPHQEGLKALRSFLDNRPHQFPSTTTLLWLAELTLTLNNFSFGSSHFLQIKGVAMDTCMGPSYACLFVGYVEQSMLQIYTGTTPQLLLRYVDNYIGAASCTHAELVNFIDFASNFHPALKFTWSILDTSLPFLDLSVSISGDRLSTDIFYKPTDSHNYLDYTSSHPAQCKNVIPYSLFLCLYCICSQDEAFHSRTFQMSSFFQDRDFSSGIVKDALTRISSTSCTSALNPSSRHYSRDRVPLVLTYHPTSLQIQHIILRNFRHLQQDPTTKYIFPSLPLSAFCRDRSLRDYLVHTSLPTELPPGIYPCKRKCYTCLHTSPLTTIPGPRQSFQVRQHFTCESAGVVYCILCSRCGLLYIGETRCRLGDRFVKHLRSVCHNRQDLPVATHFNSASHSHLDMSIHGLLYCHDEAKLRMEEQHLIYRLGSLQPGGMNIEFSNFRVVTIGRDC
ncbi:divergent protein kinase domain 1C isoform X2 [Hypanus sabinus]|uniref:divergent protein kinase domain 1C isoform X2 n=1 Tax=Hypanus sabinus TaxID=79690 RepID=UPI0028C482DC|nr:divergent protein kinase domain 1C isoform X2 [Hypanus sabinus]